MRDARAPRPLLQLLGTAVCLVQASCVRCRLMTCTRGLPSDRTGGPPACPLAAWPPAAQGRRAGEGDRPSSRTGGSSGMSLAAWQRAAQARRAPQQGGAAFKPQNEFALAAEPRKAAAASVAVRPRLNPRLRREGAGDKAHGTTRSPLKKGRSRRSAKCA